MAWLILSICLGALGQLCLKFASTSVKDKPTLQTFYLALTTNYHIWLGIICYGLSFIIWVRILTKYDLSFARPFAGLGYVLTAILAIFFLGEKINLLRWIGIFLIVAGITVISLSGDVQ